VAATTQNSTISESPRKIRVAKEAEWRGFLAWNTASDNLERVFDAIIHDPVSNKDVTVCVKLYPSQEGKNRGMVNEITGWLIAHALNIPQPASAYLVKVPIKELAAPIPDWIKGIKKTTKHYWAFATLKLPAESAAIRFHRAEIPLLIEDIRRWSDLPSAVALDEHIANTDRHLNNLLRLGKGNYALIDNGRLAVENGTKNWTASDLVPNKPFANLLSQQCWKDSPPYPYASTTVDAGAKHADALSSVRTEIEDWWNRLIPDAAERQAFNHFITARANQLATLLNNRFNLLPL